MESRKPISKKMSLSARRNVKTDSFSFFKWVNFQKCVFIQCGALQYFLLQSYQPQVLSLFLMFADMGSIKQHFILFCISLVSTTV